MGWTSKMRASRNPKIFKRNGNYRSGSKSLVNTVVKKENNDDQKNRQKIVQEIVARCNAENLDDIVNEISQRKEVKEQFDYYIKNGITDLSSIFKNWYLGYENNKSRNNNISIR